MSKIVSKEVQEFVDNRLDKGFFESNPLKQMSAYRIMDITFSVDAMDEQIYKELPEDKKKQIKEENKIAENEEDIDKLYNMLRKELNPSTIEIIANKLMKHKEMIVPRMLESLKRSGNDCFVESSARILIKAEDNYSKAIAAILSEIKYPYTKAVMCYVLGKIGNEEYIQTLYNQFISFKKNYKDDEYSEGPLLGLYELKRKYEF
ncbi:hypothetical protein HMPREF1982_01544 [Clostridiales bacterium oral taxon 876 str. F0540]|nr:hypothetical protein HMPREF1982_01544 [Clostridiales bacterium oral taxon 876 str. F0540]